MNNSSQNSNKAPVKDYPTSLKVAEFLIGFLGFGLLDAGLIYLGSIFNSQGLSDAISIFVALIINLIGIYAFQKKYKYISLGITFIFVLIALFPLLFFGMCLISPLL